VTRTLSVAAPMFILNLQMHRARLEAALPDRHIIQEGPACVRGIRASHDAVGSIERVDYRPDAAHAAGIWMGKTESSEADTVIAFIELYIYNHAQL
jgi:hypothetical protein